MSSDFAGCATTTPSKPEAATLGEAPTQPVQLPMEKLDEDNLVAHYAEREDGGFVFPAIDFRKVPPRFYPQRVKDVTGQPAGTIVVDTPSRYLYLVERGGTAMRYGVGIGRDGFAWQGEGVIHWRQKWAHWKPPHDMIAREPSLEKFSAENGGMPPGLRNPLGARTMYIFKDGHDTLYRIHGSPYWETIGKAASSGCVRMINQDAIDLYYRVPFHARIVVSQVPVAIEGA